MKKLLSFSLLVLVSISGCKLSGANSVNSSSSKDTSTVAADPRKSVSDALQKLRSVPFVTAKTERSDSDSDFTIEKFSAADQSYSQSSVSEEDSQMVIVGKETFSKMNSYWPWRKESDSSESAADRFFSHYDRIVRYLPDLNAAADGQELVDGRTANVIILTTPKPTSDWPASIKIWIDKENGLPLKFVTEVSSDTKNTKKFDFQSPVKIERPVVGKKEGLKSD
jgi:outer membrane lipoprotein-sorting protein